MITPSIVNDHRPQHPYDIIPGPTERYSALSTAQARFKKDELTLLTSHRQGGGGSINCFRRRVFSACALVGKTQATCEETRLTSSVFWSFSPLGPIFCFSCIPDAKRQHVTIHSIYFSARVLHASSYSNYSCATALGHMGLLSRLPPPQRTCLQFTGLGATTGRVLRRTSPTHAPVLSHARIHR